MNKFIAVRHGESEANVLKIFSNDRTKYPLTETGKAQVREAANQMKGLSFDGILCSPVLRTRQTAEILADALGLDCDVDERIRETEIRGMEGKQIREMSAADRKLLGIESWESHVSRMTECVDSRDGSYIIVSHALPIRTLVCYYAGITDEDSCKGVEIRYASMSAILCNHSDILSFGAIILSPELRKKYTNHN